MLVILFFNLTKSPSNAVNSEDHGLGETNQHDRFYEAGEKLAPDQVVQEKRFFYNLYISVLHIHICNFRNMNHKIMNVLIWKNSKTSANCLKKFAVDVDCHDTDVREGDENECSNRTPAAQ